MRGSALALTTTTVRQSVDAWSEHATMLSQSHDSQGGPHRVRDHTCLRLADGRPDHRPLEAGTRRHSAAAGMNPRAKARGVDVSWSVVEKAEVLLPTHSRTAASTGRSCRADRVG